MIAAAIAKAGTDRAGIRDAIEGLKDYVGITAVYSYGPDDHFGGQSRQRRDADRQGRQVHVGAVSGPFDRREAVPILSVRFADSDCVRIEARPAETILAAARGAGIPLSSDCEVGDC